MLNFMFTVFQVRAWKWCVRRFAHAAARFTLLLFFSFLRQYRALSWQESYEHEATKVLGTARPQSLVQPSLLSCPTASSNLVQSLSKAFVLYLPFHGLLYRSTGFYTPSPVLIRYHRFP